MPSPGEASYGHLVLYDEANNTLKLIEKDISSRDKSGLDFMRQVARGGEEATAEGIPVFAYLENSAAEKMPVF
jgi:hypothetical protein